MILSVWLLVSLLLHFNTWHFFFYLKIILEGVIGNGLAGDLAIDDITFPDSTCGGIV